MRNRILENIVNTEPADDSLTTDEAKAWIKMAFSDDDAVIASLITSARKWVEAFCNVSIGLQTREVHFSHDGVNGIQLPNGPMVELVSLQYRSCHLCAWEDIDVDTDTSFELNYSDFIGRCGFYTAFYDCGYYSGGNAVPAGILDGMKRIVALMYDHRGDDNGFTVDAITKHILQPYKVNKF